ncbi:hypothetical protein NDU88_001440 [Pleurodeles waltl]|uniref:Uncharacterized protein n=1 Tax=Pleurodeles waltl TaxID=8319 RepID=A0AAV7S816_PLEWA|nr:hypothetical protein NDU88_001440 [Pleurodeles waltl]
MAGWTVQKALCAVSWLFLLQPVLGQDTSITANSTQEPAGDKGLTESQRIAAITVPCVVGGIVLIAILIFVILKVREKRQTEGTYHPSSEEQSSGKELGHYGKDNLEATWEDERASHMQGTAV